MIALDRQSDVLHRLQEVHRSCPEMRLGQLLATVAMLGEDSTGRSLWDIEDDELSAAVERFASDLAGRRTPDSALRDAYPAVFASVSVRALTAFSSSSPRMFLWRITPSRSRTKIVA